MEKTMKKYLLWWAVLLVLFNAIAFIAPGWIFFEKYTPSFWLGYTLVMVCFVLQLVCAMTALKQENAAKIFYHMPLIRISYTGLILSFVFGGACMLLSPLPYWLAGLLCLVVLVLVALALIKAKTAADVVSDMDAKVRRDTFFIKTLTLDAQSLMEKTEDPAAREACARVYEALRYSDPMSAEALGTVEEQLGRKFHEFKLAVKAGDEKTPALGAEIVTLAEERARLCRLFK